ncbi:MAG: hypothetical protein WA003_08205 [Desulfuromonadaceae bacterium]
MKRLIVIALLLITPVVPASAFNPGIYDILMQAGEDYILTVTESNNGTPINLSGTTYAAQFRSAPAPAGIVFATYSAFTNNPAAGNITVKLSKAQTLAQSGAAGVWDLRRTDASGLVSYRLSGKCIVRPTVTR